MSNYTSFTVDIPDKDLIESVAANFSPEEVFPVNELEAWAENNGYILKDN